MAAKPRLAIGHRLADSWHKSGGLRLRIGANRLAVASAQAQSQNESEKVNGKDHCIQLVFFTRRNSSQIKHTAPMLMALSAMLKAGK